MAIIDFPTEVKINQILFKPLYFNRKSMNSGSAFKSVNFAPPLWEVNLTTTKLDDDQYDIMQATLDKLRGGINILKIYDASKKYPKKYPSGFGGLTRPNGLPFTGKCQIASIISNGRVTIGDFPASFNLSIGDYFAYYTNNSKNRYLHRIDTDTVSNSSGIVDITFNMPLSSAANISTICDFSDVYMYCIVDDDTVMPSREVGNSEGLQLKALQSIRIG